MKVKQAACDIVVAFHGKSKWPIFIVLQHVSPLSPSSTSSISLWPVAWPGELSSTIASFNHCSFPLPPLRPPTTLVPSEVPCPPTPKCRRPTKPAKFLRETSTVEINQDHEVAGRALWQGIRQYRWWGEEGRGIMSWSEEQVDGGRGRGSMVALNCTLVCKFVQWVS